VPLSARATTMRAARGSAASRNRRAILPRRTGDASRAVSAVRHRLVLALAGTAAAEEPRAQFRLDGGSPHVDVPFQLELAVEGFDESPAPDLPTLELPNATITPLGATPNVSRSIQIINGRRSDSVRVTWSLRWRIEVHKPGGLRVRRRPSSRHQARDRAGR